MRLTATCAAAVGLVVNLSACGAPPVTSQAAPASPTDVAPSVDSPSNAQAERQDAALAREQKAHPPKDVVGQAVWWPAKAVGPNTQEFDVMVLELECASGNTAWGRIKPPTIESNNDSVTVTFKVRPITVAEGEGVDCQGHPPTAHRLDLGEPLGGRRLLDGGTQPPRLPSPRAP